jgi:hypothetical protein
MNSAHGIGASLAPSAAVPVIGVELDGQAVLYHEELRSVHVLDEIATIIWNRLDGQTTLESLAAELAEAYGADPEVILYDILTAVREFGRMGLLDGITPDTEVVVAHRLTQPHSEGAPDA